MTIDFMKYCELVQQLNEWGDAYAQGAPVVSDVVYDESYRDLKLFEMENPDDVNPESPTKKVASDSVKSNGFIREHADKVAQRSFCGRAILIYP